MGCRVPSTSLSPSIVVTGFRTLTASTRQERTRCPPTCMSTATRGFGRKFLRQRPRLSHSLGCRPPARQGLATSGRTSETDLGADSAMRMHLGVGLALIAAALTDIGAGLEEGPDIG